MLTVVPASQPAREPQACCWCVVSNAELIHHLYLSTAVVLGLFALIGLMYGILLDYIVLMVASSAIIALCLILIAIVQMQQRRCCHSQRL